LTEANNDNSVAYFFFSPTTANAVFAPLRTKQRDEGSTTANWVVTQFSLGLVWFELLEEQADQDAADADSGTGIEYRLIPEATDLAAARDLVQQMQSAEHKLDAALFQSDYNQVPVFIDQRLRVPSQDGPKIPLYFGVNDLVETCQQVAEDKPDFEAAVGVVALKDLLEQMQQENNEIDFRKVAFVPPSQQVEAEKTPWKRKNKDDSIDTLDLSTTSADSWSD